MPSIIGPRTSLAVPNRFVDVHLSDVVSDPVAGIAAAYERMGRNFHAVALET